MLGAGSRACLVASRARVGEEGVVLVVHPRANDGASVGLHRPTLKFAGANARHAILLAGDGAAWRGDRRVVYGHVRGVDVVYAISAITRAGSGNHRVSYRSRGIVVVHTIRAEVFTRSGNYNVCHRGRG